MAEFTHSSPGYADGLSTTTTNECITVSSPTAVTLSGFKGGQGQSGGQVALNWTTATELNTAGFNIYRAEQPDGPYSRINAQLIAANADALSGGKYQYVDTSVVPGKTYYYQVEDVELNGARVRHPAIAVAVQSNSPFSAGVVLGGLALGALMIVIGRIAIRRRRA